MIQNLMTSPSPWQQIDFRLAATVSNILVIINSSSNFVLYSSLSTKFRLTFGQLFCARCYHAAGNGTLTTAADPTPSRARSRNNYRLVGGRETQL